MELGNFDEYLRDFKKSQDSFWVIKDQKIIFRSREKGLKPILAAGKNLRGGEIFDKVVGRAAALLFIYFKVKKVKTIIAGKKAIEILAENNIEFEFEKSAENILQKNQKDICPMEKLALNKTPETFFRSFQ